MKMSETLSLPENAALSLENQKVFQKKVANFKKKRKQHAEQTGVIYIGHIPKGFYDQQMKKYFKQFGEVNKIRLARSKKTGGYKGYGYIEFASAAVAKIVAETMNNYLMFHKLLKCEFIPAEHVHPKTFNQWDKPYKFGMNRKKNRLAQNNPKSVEKQKKNAKMFLKKTNKTIAWLKEMGIDFEFTNFVNLIPGVSDEYFTTKPTEKENADKPQSDSGNEERKKEEKKVKRDPDTEVDTPVTKRVKKIKAVSSPSISSTTDTGKVKPQKRKAVDTSAVPKKHKKK